MAWRHDERASTSAIGLSIAAGLFALAFTVANVMVEEPAGVDHSATSMDLSATTALDVIIGQSGRSATNGAWVSDADHLGRFGLAQDDQPNFLDYTKIKSMRNASMTSASNLAPDYPDVRAALGIRDLNFHLRTYPVIPGLDDPRWTKDPRGRVAYVAHVDKATGHATMTPTSSTSGNVVNIDVTIRNDGAADHIFTLDLAIGDRTTNKVIVNEQRHTALLPAAGTQTITFRVPKQNYDTTFNGVRLELSDSFGNRLVDPYWVAITPPTGSNAPFGLLMNAGKNYYQVGDKVTFLGDHYDEKGRRDKQDEPGRFVLIGPNGREWVNSTITLPKNQPYKYECTNCTATGTYTGRVWNSAVTLRATDTVHVSPTVLFNEHYTVSAVAAREIGILKDLVTNFNGQEYDATTAPNGDVFVDDGHIRDLDDVIARYSTLVVGSETSQNSLNMGETKWAIADWVQDGGNLVALGSTDAQGNNNWLQPVYHAAVQTANGGISAPDPTHPILTSPNKIDHTHYLDNGRAWNIRDDQPFTHILARGASGGSHDDALAVAAPGAYNDGTVVLTSYMPGALTNPQDDSEAKRFLHNLLSQSYTMLFLDYGPPIPAGVPVGSAQRLVAIPHPNVPGAVVEVRIVMYAWQGT